jgi:hypothetical protein
MRQGVIHSVLVAVFFSLKYRSSRCAPIPIIHFYKMAVNDVSFHQHAVIEFLIKENVSAADIFDKRCYVCGDSYIDASSL